MEPTDDGSERALRPVALWRKGSLGSNGEGESRLAARLLTVLATCRQQGRRLLDFLVPAGVAALQVIAAPSLLRASGGGFAFSGSRTSPDALFRTGGQMAMLSLLRTRLREAAEAVAPLVCVVCVLQVVLVHAPAAQFIQFLAGSVLVMLGLLLLFAGIEIGILPMGRFIGAELPMRRAMWLILSVAFALGFATTVAEPDVLVLARQVEAESQGSLQSQTLIFIIAAGVGLFTAIGLLRIVRGFSMTALLTGVYAVVIVLSLVAPENVVPLAYDAGSVTTGVLTAPVVLALALGLASVLAERSAMDDGFGLLGLASAGPIITILLLGLLL